MANENLENRFERIKRTALNGVILLSTFMPYGCSHNFYSLNEDTKQTTEQVAQDSNKQNLEKKAEYVPTLEDFKKVLGKERLEGVADAELEKSWENENEQSKRIWYQTYEKGDKFLDEVPSKIKEGYAQFDANSLNPQELSQYDKMLPWKFKKENNKFSEEDSVALFLLHYIHTDPLEIEDIDILTGKIYLKN